MTHPSHKRIEELKKLLDHPRYGLKDSSDTNKTRMSILDLFLSREQELFSKLEELKKGKRAYYGRETSWEIENKNGYHEALSDCQALLDVEQKQ